MAGGTTIVRWAPCAVALAAFVVYALTASGHGYWLDSGEFTAAAVALDIAHPPSHPLAQLWAKPFTLIPIGPLPYRAAIAQSAAAALALAFVQLAIARTIAHATGLTRLASTLLACAATLAVGGAYALWFQAVRAEVYALEALLVCIALERLSRLACADDGDVRPMYGACLALGLGLANHHFIALLAFPSLAYELVRLTRTGKLRLWWSCLLIGALGLTTYAYLPLRASREPPMDLGHPVTWADFVWVISARVYARNIGSEALQPLSERFADLAVLLVENLTVPLLVSALLGLYALLRTRHFAIAYLWLVTAVVSLCGRAYLNPVRANPDVLGYMIPGFVALAALAAVGTGALLRALVARMSMRIVEFVAGGLALLSPLQFVREAERASLANFDETLPFDALYADVPARTLLLLTTPAQVFRAWERQAVEALRDDVVIVPVPFLGYGATHEVLLRRHPELRALVEGYLQSGALDIASVRALAQERPVRVELDARVTLDLYGELVPDGALYRPSQPLEPMHDALASAMEARRTLAARLRHARDPETHRQLLWDGYIAALYLAARGQHEAARAVTQGALRAAPHARELTLLREALTHARAGPLDITPFLPERLRSP